jgi:site-specific DNA recombinase
VYTDDGISGAEFARRPGLVRLLAALKPRPPFGVLLVSDRDRLGREQIETSYLLKQLITAGVRVFEVSRGQEITLSSPTDKVLASVTAFAGELEREQARVRTHAALGHRAQAGRATGGTCFGYTTTPTPEGHTVRAIVPAEAAVVRRAFELAAEGHGVKAIARMLNAEAAQAPRKAGRVSGWAPSSVRGVLRNELYRGIAVWNRSRKRDAWGQRHPTRRDEAEVIRADVPALRIVDEALWQRAHERLTAGRLLYSHKLGGSLLAGRPSGQAGRYLLTGLCICSQCGGGMMARKRGQHAVHFGCMTRHLRGRAVCDNGLEVRLTDADAAVLAAVESQLLNVAVLETALAKALEALAGQDEQDRDEPLRQELARLDAEVGRLTAAIAAGGSLASLLSALQDREQRRAHLRTALADQARQRAAQHRQGDVLTALRAALTDWQGTLRQETPATRQALQALLSGRLSFSPGPEGYTFSGPGTVAPIIAGLVPKGSGARTRTIPPALRRALHHRDRGCRFPGCGVRFGQGHHIRHWAQGGPTTLSNLALLCRRHHRAVHEEGFQLDRQADGELQFRRPDGRGLPDVPPPAEVPGDPVEVFRTRHEADGLELHARTGMPGWLGERLDVGWAIDVLHPVAT